MLLQMALFYPFLWLVNIPLYVWHHIFLVHCSVNRLLAHFHVLAVVNGAAVNVSMDVSSGIMGFSGYILRSGIARSYGSSIFSF